MWIFGPSLGPESALRIWCPPGFLDLPTALSHKNEVTQSLKPQFYGTHQEFDAFDSELLGIFPGLQKYFNYTMYI